MVRLIRIANWKLALLALVFFCLFSWLGVWQLQRASQKSVLMKSFAARMAQEPLTVQDLAVPQRFSRLKLQGKFDAQHTFLLDNKTFHGQIGYEVYTPFKADGLETTILIDRGFIPLHTNRAILPTLQTPAQTVTIIGMLNLPPSYVALGEMRESERTSWPQRIEYIHLDKIAKLLRTPLFPYIVTIAPNDPAAYAVEWKAVIMGPERHRGYALQWFALALTLLILFFALNRGDKKP